ncbi:MAG: ATP synthase F1 subunit epsilon [Pirellulales bacterium]|nr:ATP synthase F1 subunit epsilon [Pirellulales bacterium]MBX3433964.1 ATP synthase F1 subunit epsilon [Pirellulales bacterium]
MADNAPITASGSTLRCIVVTPEETVVDRDANFVALPLFDGELGVALYHAPMIGRLGFGELRVRTGTTEERFYVDGGFVQVADNVVSVLTNRSIPAKKLDAATIDQQVREVGSSVVAGETALALRERQLKQLRAQSRVAGKG